MKEIFGRVWDEHFFENCSDIEKEEDRELLEKAATLREKMFSMLNQEQKIVLTEYIEVLAELETLVAKNAFLKGCDFTSSFIEDVRNLDK